ncbi:MAG: hypothetical protein KME27_10650 [Lyngbya sp. HA4199-MV5]|jgi:hypothetical protein|nr:hypothetical protein [Lyngbya sp. HA4199-MV5]
MANAYTDATAMLALVRELTSIDSATISDYRVNLMLSDSAGTDSTGTKTYRPYFVGSTLIRTNRSDQSIVSADGATFQSLTVSEPKGTAQTLFNLPALVQGYMEQQQRLDRSLGLTVPDGFSAVLNPGSAVMSIFAGP